jgi:hypothetical protein
MVFDEFGGYLCGGVGGESTVNQRSQLGVFLMITWLDLLLTPTARLG